MKKWLIPYVLLYFYISLSSVYPEGRPIAMGGAYSGLSDDVWAIFYNVGGLSRLNDNEVSIAYSPNRFGLAELSQTSIAGGIPTNFGVIGFSARRFGFDLYKEMTSAISYATKFSDIGVGVNLNYHIISIKNYGDDGTFSFDVGLWFPIIKSIQYGIFVKNVNASTIGESKSKIPQTFQIGVSYLPLKNFSVNLDYFKEFEMLSSFNFGVEYWLIEWVAFRAGVINEPSQYTGGIGLRYGVVQLDYAFSMHTILGVTQTISILFNIKRL